MQCISHVRDRPLLISGMHRSGTSLTASLAMSAGVKLGNNLLGANDSNPAGHFEDLGFQDFHRRALAAAGVCANGYTATANGTVSKELESEAGELIASHRGSGVTWGWKDPRTTLFLDFWQDHLPHACHLFVFRRPWEVADSLFRRGDETFAMNPGLAFDVWKHYNRLILDFSRRNPARCVLFEISSVIASPRQVFGVIRTRLDIDIGVPDDKFQPHLFHCDETSKRAGIVRALMPEVWRTYLALRAAAGCTTEIDATLTQALPLGRNAILEWARESRAFGESQREGARSVPAPPPPVPPSSSWRILASLVGKSRRSRDPLPKS